MRLSPALALMGLLAGPASADAPVPDPPAEAVETSAMTRDARTFALPVAAYGGEEAPARRVTGPFVRRTYRVPEASMGVGAVLSRYEDAVRSLGYEPVFRCEDEACGGFEFRFGVDAARAPALVLDVGSIGALSAVRDDAVISILASAALGDLWLQVTTVEPEGDQPREAAEPPREAPATGPPSEDAAQPAPAPPSDPEQSQPAQAAPAAQRPARGDAAGMFRRLRRTGRAVVAGLDFDVGGERLTDASGPVLDDLAERLIAEPDLSIAIVGHTDTQGGLELNIAISKRRAEAVRTALIERGVEGARLEAEGVAFLAPLAPNDTPEGRAENRRVEIVLR